MVKKFKMIRLRYSVGPVGEPRISSINLYSMIFAKICSVNPRLTLLNPRCRSLQYIHLLCESPFHSGLGRWLWFSEIIVHITLCVCHISEIGCSAFAIFPKIGCNNFFQILIRFSDLTPYIHTITYYESDSINNVEVNYDFL
jgi:hypothetical protein